MALGQDDVHEPSAVTPKAKTKKRRKTIRVRADIAHGGTLHVRHMKNTFYGEPCVLMGGAPEGGPIWIQLAKQGRFLGHSAGPFEMTNATFAEIVRNFKAHPEHIPIDFEHASESDASSGSIPHTGAPAQGWIVDMKVDRGELYGLVEWGTLARDYIKNGQYKYFSPAIRFNAKDRVTGKAIGARMTSGALTNSPFLSGLQKVAAKDTDELDELDDENQLLVETEADVEIEKKLKDTEDKLAITTDKFTLADTKAKELEKTITAKDAELTMVKTENASLLSWKTERENKDQADEVEIAFDTYKDARKLTDAMKAPMLATLKAAPEAFRSMYPKIAPSQQHLQRNLTDHRDPTPVLDVTPGAGGDAQLEKETFSQTVNRLMSEKKISYLAASNQAAKLRG